MRPLYLGDFHPELEGQFVARLAQLPSADCRRLLVLVPNRLLALHLRRRAAALGVPTLGLRPQSLEDTIRELASPALAAAGTKILPEWAAPHLLSEILGGRRLGARRHGAQRSLAATVRDLRDAGIAAEGFQRLTRGRPGWAPRVVELAAYYRRYVEALERRNLADDARCSAVATQRVRAGGLAAEQIWLYGFYELVARQRAFVEALLERHGCEVFFPWGEADAFRYARPLREWFEARGCEALELRREASPPALSWQSAPTHGSEAQEVLRWIAQHDAALSMGILPRQEGDTESFRFAARGARRPVHLLARESWRRQPAGRALSALLELAAGRLGFDAQREGEALSRAKVEELLASGALHPAITGEEALSAHPERWIQALRRQGVVAGLEGWHRLVAAYAAQPDLFRLPAAAAAVEEERDHTLRRELVAIAAFVARLLEDTSLLSQEARNWARRASRLGEVLRRWLAPGAARATLLARCAALGELEGVLAPSWTHFRAAVEEILDEPAVEGPRFGEAPTVAPLLTARGVTFDCLVLPRLVERNFPRQAREDPWLSDEERRRLGRELDGVEPPLKAALAREEERLLFHLALGSARQRVLLSWPRAGEGGRAVVPSSFLLELARRTLGREVAYEALGAGGDLSVHRAEPGDSLSARMPLSRLEADLAAIDEVARGAVGVERLAGLSTGAPRLSAALAALRHRRSPEGVGQLTEFDGLVGPELAGRWLAGVMGPGGALRISASALESYARCGFAFFLERVLRVESAPAPERSLELDPRTVGSVFHELLREMFLDLAKERLLPLSAEALEFALRRVEPALEDLVRDQPWLAGEGPPALWRAGRRRLVADLRAFLRAEADRTPEGWRPREFELAFGGAAEVEIEAGGERLRLRGRIDRIDEKARAIRVVDYKTGRLDKLGKAGEIVGGTRLQLPLYRLALLALRAERREIHGAYLGLDSRSAFERVDWWPDDFARAAPALDAAVAGIVQGLRQGLFHQIERDRFCDQACAFTSLCGPGRKGAIAAKSGDARVRDAASWRENRTAAEEGTETP